MSLALTQAELASSRGEIPIGAILVDTNTNTVLASYGNMVEELHSATAHAEILAINQASNILNTSRLAQCDLYVTLEPCAMCAGAISLAKIRRLYFGASSVKTGAIFHGPQIFSKNNSLHKPEIYDGIMARDSQLLINEFFNKLRDI